MDGSQKIPQRLLATVRDRLENGGSIEHLALAIAGWIRYASGTDEHGKAIAVADPMSARFAAIAAAAHGNASQIWPTAFSISPRSSATISRSNPVFRSAVARDVGGLMRDGVRRTLAVHIAQRVD